MVAAGLLTGEAFFGTESSILSFIDTLVDDPFATSWYIGRLVICTTECNHWCFDLLAFQEICYR